MVRVADAPPSHDGVHRQLPDGCPSRTRPNRSAERRRHTHLRRAIPACPCGGGGRLSSVPSSGAEDRSRHGRGRAHVPVAVPGLSPGNARRQGQRPVERIARRVCGPVVRDHARWHGEAPGPGRGRLVPGQVPRSTRARAMGQRTVRCRSRLGWHSAVMPRPIIRCDSMTPLVRAAGPPSWRSEKIRQAGSRCRAGRPSTSATPR